MSRPVKDWTCGLFIVFLLLVVLSCALTNCGSAQPKPAGHTTSINVKIREGAAESSSSPAREYSGIAQIETPPVSGDYSVLTAIAGVFGALVTLIVGVFTWNSSKLNVANQKMETLVKSVGLLGASTGGEAPASQKFGALMTLIEMGHLEFALTLLEPMWASNKIDSTCAVWLIDKGLTSTVVEFQEMAANILRSNATSLTKHDGKFRSDGGCAWPASVNSRWNENLSLYAQEFLLESLLNAILSVPRPKPDKKNETWDIDSLRGMYTTIMDAVQSTKHQCIWQGAALAAEVLSPVIDKGLRLQDGRMLTVAQLNDEIESAKQRSGSPEEPAVTDVVRDSIERLREWLNK